jgi:hypothetical protein
LIKVCEWDTLEVPTEEFTLNQLQTMMVVITAVIIAVCIAGYFAFRWFMRSEARKNRGGE